MEHNRDNQKSVLGRLRRTQKRGESKVSTLPLAGYTVEVDEWPRDLEDNDLTTEQIYAILNSKRFKDAVHGVSATRTRLEQAQDASAAEADRPSSEK